MNNPCLNKEIIIDLVKLFNLIIKEIFNDLSNFNINNIFNKLENIDISLWNIKSYKEKILKLKNNIMIKDNNTIFDIKRLSKIKNKFNELEKVNLNHNIIFNDIIKNFNENDIINELNFEMENYVSKNGLIFKNKINKLIEENKKLQKEINKNNNDIISDNILLKDENESLKNTINLIINDKKIWKQKHESSITNLNNKINELLVKVKDIESIKINNLHVNQNFDENKGNNITNISIKLNVLLLKIKEIYKIHNITKEEIFKNLSIFKQQISKISKSFKFKIRLDKENIEVFKFITNKLDIKVLNLNRLNYFMNELLKLSNPIKNSLLYSQIDNLKDKYNNVLTKYTNFNCFINEEGYKSVQLLNDFKWEYNNLFNYFNNLNKFKEFLTEIKLKFTNNSIINKVNNIEKNLNIKESRQFIKKLQNFDRLNINYLYNNYNGKIDNIKKINSENNNNLEIIKAQIIDLKNLINK